MLAIALVLSFLAAVQAGCDNACSGHGTCGERGICTCYDNWGLGLAHYAGDCSQRICPYEIAWIDRPSDIGAHHKYAECANRGICNRDSGECQCFPGYEGKACQRSTCPNDCSGHGRCAYIENLPFQNVPMDYHQGNFLNQDPVTFPNYFWDNHKERGCICDPEYGDVDCSKRMCMYATDIMDQRQDMSASAKYQVQSLVFEADGGLISSLYESTFALTFKSKLNETFTTYPIVFDGTAAGFHDMILDIQRALEALPNRVIDSVVVAGTYDSAGATINVTFTGSHVQGPQNLLTVRSYECGAGCTPRITGMNLIANTMNVTVDQLSDFNSFECGRRGKCDYNTGLCSCFSGYTGVGCNIITSLV